MIPKLVANDKQLLLLLLLHRLDENYIGMNGVHPLASIDRNH